MKKLPTRLAGLVLIQPDVYRDERGFFLETYRRDAYARHGVDAEFVQDNHSRSQRGTLRGLHFQLQPGQPKLVRVASGRVQDVVVDLRRSSPTFGQWESFELDDEAQLQLFVPVGFAHGFCVLSSRADVVYKVGTYYSPDTERGIAWDDPDLAIQWQNSAPVLSRRDQGNPLLHDALEWLPSW